ncbi:hypothetical protein F442_22625 [Phytophthora nicotianae P10297]|uniref:Uncharacterized protein n=1 Tax=Phytophthora nicotianae P10297 TaxID=1317064 RepID=W2XZE1_PHYNI|nr:hypothetical protein F442_22625 [Phytophthora nicotianae P10297]
MTLIPDFSFDPGEKCGEEDMAVQGDEQGVQQAILY